MYDFLPSIFTQLRPPCGYNLWNENTVVMCDSIWVHELISIISLSIQVLQLSSCWRFSGENDWYCRSVQLRPWSLGSFQIWNNVSNYSRSRFVYCGRTLQVGSLSNSNMHTGCPKIQLALGYLTIISNPDSWGPNMF